MKFRLITGLLVFFSFSLQAQEPLKNMNRISEYLKFLETYEDHLGSTGDHTVGEIEIIRDPVTIANVEKEREARLIKRGVSEELAASWSKVGFVEGDSHWIWIRDAVILPSGRKTIKGRLSWKASMDGPQGVVSLPVLKDKRIIVCLKYKHALRSWQIELPRGARLYGESPVDAVKRELRNETGFLAGDHLYLGSVAVDSNNINSLIPVFLQKINSQSDHRPDDERAVLGFLVLSKEEIKDAFLKGYIKLKLHGKTQKVSVNDANLSFAILQAESRGLI